MAKVLLFSVVAAVITLATVPFLYRPSPPEPAIDESGMFTVISVIGGHSGRFGGSFDHRVRADSGFETTITFRQIFPRGARIWMSYRRNPDTNRIRVKLYAQKDDSPSPPQQPR